MFVGFGSKKQVSATFLNAFSDGRAGERLGDIADLTVAQFKRWLDRGDTSDPIARWMTEGGRGPNDRPSRKARVNALLREHGLAPL